MKEKNTEEKTRIIFKDIKEKFGKWRFNMYLCAFVYVVIFIFARYINEEIIKPRSGKWLSKNETLVVSLTIFILGVCFIADSIITSYLKTPLQRLAIKIENSPVDDKEKGNLMREAQMINELFKETFKKFGILVIPALLMNVIDLEEYVVKNTEGNIIGKVEKIGKKNSESLVFYICYLIPILYATYKIIQVSKRLEQIKGRIMNEQRKQQNNS